LAIWVELTKQMMPANKTGLAHGAHSGSVRAIEKTFIFFVRRKTATAR